MSEQSFYWIAGIFATIVSAIVAALWSHIVADADHREKIARELAELKADSDTTTEELKGLRQRFHDFRDGTMRDAWSLFQKMKDEIMQTVREMFRDRQ